uniref:Transient receptor potential cation channel protein painlesslike [Acyrthosiphon pisum] n=1 Tax=Lepeophtheirus salmonis TaxID=72036 RepID=A0A0K2VB98_LEPSM
MYTKLEDSVPLADMKKGRFCRTTSCFGELEENAIRSFLQKDKLRFNEILAEVSPSSDDDIKRKTLPSHHWINEGHQRLKFKSFLHIALEDRNEEFVNLLLRAGARADTYNEVLGVGLLHVAIEAGNYSNFVSLVKYGADVNLVDRKGLSPLHYAVQSDGNVDIFNSLIHNEKVDELDAEDLAGRRTPLYLAVVQAKNRYFAEALLKRGADSNITVHGKPIKQAIQSTWPSLRIPEKSNSSIVESKELLYGLNRLLDKAQMNKRSKESNAQNLLHFKIILQKMSEMVSEINKYNCGGMTFIQKSSEYGLPSFVEALLDQGCNPQATLMDNPTIPILLAAAGGQAGVLSVFKAFHLNDEDSCRKRIFSTSKDVFGGENIIHWILKKSQRDRPDADYQDCASIILLSKDLDDELSLIINDADELGNVPLHYATQIWGQEVVKRLLELGANIGIINQWGERPIDKILPETLEEFFDESGLQSKYDVTNEDFEITFDYSFLAPPILRQETTKRAEDENHNACEERPVLPETESLWHMSQSKNHRHLLKHPVITSFLWLKWQRIRGYFNRNLRFYLLFVVALTWYIVERFGGLSLRKNVGIASNSTSYCSDLSYRDSDQGLSFWFWIFLTHSFIQIFLMIRDWRYEISTFSRRKGKPGFGSSVLRLILGSWLEAVTLCIIFIVLYFRTAALWSVLTGLIVLLILRELFQLGVSLKRYIFTPENWLEVSMITLVCVILFVPDSYFLEPCETKRHLAAITILLSWSEMITLIARHPRLERYNIYVTMFYKVLKTFFFFLLWYSFFIFAFALGFYIMLHKDIPGYDLKNDEYTFFNYPWLSLVKTSTMFVGEIEFADIPINVNSKLSPLSYAFLLSFVFLILVVLMNLLNGLAVSDTGLIRAKAEIVSFVSRVETISYTESLLLGDPFDFLSSWPSFKLLMALPNLACCRLLFQNPFFRKISYNLTGATGILLFYRYLTDKKLTLTPNHRGRMDFCPLLSVKDMDPNVIKSAKAKIIAKNEAEKRRKESYSTEREIKELKEQIRLLTDKFDRLTDFLTNS